MKRLLAAGLVLGLAACASGPGNKSGPAKVDGKAASGSHPPRGKSPYPPAQEDLSKRGHYTAGGLYAPHIKDSAPDIDIDVSRIPEPEVVAEPRSAYGNRPTYAVLGKNYRVLDDTAGFVERGTASYYGNKFHGRRTSNMEVYDMYAFTAAHKSLPLPSFARITNLDNDRSVVVRVNDRGPFHEGRVVDLSYAAAVKLGIDRAGTGRVQVQALQPGKSKLAAAPAPAPATRGTSMDTLVATLPVGAGAGALDLPPGVRIATGKPKPTGTAAAAVTATTAGVADSGTRAPATATAAGAGSPAPAVATEVAESWRFNMTRDGRTMSADEFDAWMAQRDVRVATGRPSPVTRTAAARATAMSTPAAAPASIPAVTGTAPATADGVVLQVASFAARANADRALATLRGAGIDAANLHDGTANGKRVWRLRVGPLEAAAANGLASRIAGLGFGPPQPVTE